MKDYITLATFTYQFEYVVIKGVLEKEGIRFFLKNDTLVGIFPFYSNAFGGIHLLVHPDDYEEAKRILDHFTDNTPHLKIV